MAKSKTGALIVISSDSKLERYIETGTKINAETSSALLENIFFKNSPLHDGAVIIYRDKIRAASCILPVYENKGIDDKYGLRHRSAIGISKATNTFVIVVSEETGEISYIKAGKFYPNIKGTELRKILENEFLKRKKEKKEEISNSNIVKKLNLRNRFRKLS